MPNSVVKTLTVNGTTYDLKDVDSESYAPKASPALTGTPTAPTATSGTNSTQIATTAFVQGAVSSAIDNVDLSGYLAKNNTTAFTPSGDYNPATKKYVDDAVNGFSTTLTGLTDTTITAPSDGQGLLYDSTTSKWVNGDVADLHEPEDDVEVLNLLSSYIAYPAPIEDTDGYIITDVDDNIILG